MRPYNPVFDHFDFVFGRPWLFKKAKRPPKLFQDTEATADVNQSTCKLCLTNISCIMFKDCKHIGTCNKCCFKYLNEGFFYDKYDKKIRKQSHYPFYKYYVPNLENFTYTKKCPFCKAYVKSIEYVYLV